MPGTLYLADAAGLKPLGREDYWRGIVLIGLNVASYKFALAKTLLDLSTTRGGLVTLEDLAVPFSQHLVEHLRSAPKQTTSRSSKFLEACRRHGRGEIDQGQLVGQAVRLGFNNVIDAFHVVNRREVPIRFFADERKSEHPGIRLTDELFRLREVMQFSNLPVEVEARWKLVETVWELGLPRNTVVTFEPVTGLLTATNPLRRKSVTRARGALNGYQKGKCFYCFHDILLEGPAPASGDVDHFFPFKLQDIPGVSFAELLNGVWNLVLSCEACNRGPQGKWSLLPRPKYLERLHQRNEFLIESHHPLRETLIAQTGATPDRRATFLRDAYDQARGVLIQSWQPAVELEAVF